VGSTEPARQGVVAARVSAPSLLTIGYEGSSFAAVRDALEQAGCTLLIDVRAVAASRRAGFSKRALAAGLAEAGIGYLHLRPLGTPKPGRDAVRRGDPDTMRRIFAEHMEGDEPQRALAEAGEAATRQPACLLCFERDHAFCHRAIVADMLSSRTGQPVRHLRADPLLPAPFR
jgi:uncharacterized protein (DUF488 family)